MASALAPPLRVRVTVGAFQWGTVMVSISQTASILYLHLDLVRGNPRAFNALPPLRAHARGLRARGIHRLRRFRPRRPLACMPEARGKTCVPALWQTRERGDMY